MLNFKNLILLCGILSVFAIGDTTKKTLTKSDAETSFCAGMFMDGTTKVNDVWNKQIQDKYLTKDLTGELIFRLHSLLKSEKKFPTEQDLAKALLKKVADVKLPNKTIVEDLKLGSLKSYWALPGSAVDMSSLRRLTFAHFSEYYDGVVKDAEQELLRYFKDHLRLPTRAELAEKMRFDGEVVETLVPANDKLWAMAIQTHPQLLLEARDRIGKAFLRAVSQRDIPKIQRTQHHTPTIEEIYMALVRTEGNKKLRFDYEAQKFTVANLEVLFNQRLENVKEFTPVLFEKGVVELEGILKNLNPSAFREYSEDTARNLQNTQEIIDLVEEKPGILYSSITSGLPVVKNLIRLMIQIAEEKDYVIILEPTAQVLDGLYEEPLIQHPRIKILTRGFKNRFLEFRAKPILMKNENGSAGTEKWGQVVPGQILFLAHPQLMHKNLATSSNHLRRTQVWQPGSVSEALYPSAHQAQAGTADKAKHFHKNSFLVIEKADRKSGQMGLGAQNSWHIRPVIYRHPNPKLGFNASVTDLGTRWEVIETPTGSKIEKSKYDPILLAPGDNHDAETSQKMMAVHKEVIERYQGRIKVVLQDLRDGNSHNPWQWFRRGGNAAHLNAKFRSGELNIFKEDMGNVQSVNAYLGIRDNVDVDINYSNHDEWLDSLVDTPGATSQEIMNGRYLAELRAGKQIHGARTSLEYLFHMRNNVIDSIPDPAVRQAYYREGIFVTDPSRVHISMKGQPKVEGPEDLPTHTSNHGHMGRNGAKGSLAAHAAGNQSAFTGDSHRVEILGDEFCVGTSTSLPGPGNQQTYARGGYSSWANGFGLLYADGTKQLVTYDSLSDSYYQREGVGILPGKEFFGDSLLEPMPTDNDLVPDKQILDQHSWLVNLLKKGNR